MNSLDELISFLNNKMSMSEVYQPLIISELIKEGGKMAKKDLANKLALHDQSVQEYYEKVLMRWPKKTLEKHGVVFYNRESKEFELNISLNNEKKAKEALNICLLKINEWVESKDKLKDPEVNASIRYEVLKASKGKCALCGVSSKLRPIDVDHIVPRSRANKYGKVIKDGKAIDLNSLENLQALCFKCNRSKRDTDDTDFRKQNKLVRDNVIEEIIKSGRKPNYKVISQKSYSKALEDKLIEEVVEYLDSKKTEELADILEVVFTLAENKKVSTDKLLQITKNKKNNKGGFSKKHFYMGDL